MYKIAKAKDIKITLNHKVPFYRRLLSLFLPVYIHSTDTGSGIICSKFAVYKDKIIPISIILMQDMSQEDAPNRYGNDGPSFDDRLVSEQVGRG